MQINSKETRNYDINIKLSDEELKRIIDFIFQNSAQDDHFINDFGTELNQIWKAGR